MEVTRRQFLKAGAGGAAGTAIAPGFDLAEARAEMRVLEIARTTETRSTRPDCVVSCGRIVHTLGDRAKNATPHEDRERLHHPRWCREITGHVPPRD